MEFNNYKIKDLVKINPESIGKNYNFNTIKYLDTSNITNGFIDNIVEMNLSDAPSRAKRIVKNNDIIYSTVRPNLCHYGIMENPDDNLIVSTGFAVLRCNIDVDPLYLYSYLTLPNITKNLHLIAENSTSAYPSIKPSDLGEIEISLPNINEQKRFSKIMKCIDKKIKINAEINNNLLELSKQLYINTFSDNSDFEEIKLGELCNIKYGKGLPTTKILDNGYPVYGGNGIIGYYDSKMYDESQVLISCRGAASGKVILSKPNSFVTNNSLILEVDRLYHHYLKEYCFLNPFYAYTTGSAQPQITIDNIKDIIVKIPDSKTLEEFNCKCEAIEKKYFLNIEQNETLEQLRDTLLPKLMNGEIDLDNIEI